MKHNVNEVKRMLLAGDIGGTKTLLGLFDTETVRPRALVVRSYGTLDFDDLPSMIRLFLADGEAPRAPLDCAAFGVAGPVLGDSATLTNVPWRVEARRVGEAFNVRRVQLLNDLEAMAWSIPVLRESEVHVLQEGVARRGGNIALIAAGTGLGQALLHWVTDRFVPSASEGGHADFAARTDREIELVRMLRDIYGRAEVEQVLSGPGLLNLHRFTHRGGQCTVVDDLGAPDAPARISQSALGGRCQFCVEALRMFVSAYGAEAGNLALRGVATAGVYVGGGIAPKILRAMQDGSFIEAFGAKPPMSDLLSRMPVKVILKPDAGLLGAAVYAQSLLASA